MLGERLEITGLRKSYGPHSVLRGVDLTAHAGEVHALLGPNGAGKSTLVSIVAGLRRPDAGQVHALGVDVLTEPERLRPRLGLAAQELAFYPTHTVGENMRFFGRICGLRGARLTASVDELLAALSLGPLRDRIAGELSTGQQRRLHTACALVHRPALILLDEPTVGADPQTRAGLVRFVAGLAADGAVAVYTTHYLNEVEQLAARVTIIGDGRVLAHGSVDDLVSRYAESGVVLSFDGPPPPVDWPGTQASPTQLRLPAVDPAAAVSRAVEAVGEARHRLRAVSLVRADLERAYLAVVADAEAAGAEAEAAPDANTDPEASAEAARAGAERVR